MSDLSESNNLPPSRSPYRGFKVTDPAGIQTAFRKELSEALSPIIAEVISEPTRAAQQRLLVTASLLLLVTFSVVTLKDTAELNGIHIEVVPGFLRKIAFTICLYFELIVIGRSLLDWSAWRIRSGASQLRYDDAIDFSYQHVASGADGHIDRFRESVVSKSERHPDDEPRPSDEELARRAKDRRLAKDVLEAERAESNLKGAWIASKIRPLRVINSVRIGLEVLFPIVFGAVALLIPAVRWVK